MAVSKISGIETAAILTDITDQTNATAGTVTYVKRGFIVQINIAGVTYPNGSSANPGYLTLPTVPVGERPAAVTEGALHRAGDDQTMDIWVRPEGTFGLRNYDIGTGKIYGTLTWIIA
jgi:hypothetical protein